MYAMKEVASSLYRIMMFPHNGKVVTINQLTYHEPDTKGTPDNINSHVHNHLHLEANIDPKIIKKSTLLGAYHGEPPITPHELVCVLSTEGDSDTPN